MDFCDLLARLRSHTFFRDRDITLQTNRYFYLGDGTQVTASCFVPIGGVIFWPSTAGAIPTGWAVFAALQGRFPVGADGATFVNGATGGAETIDIEHNHTGTTGAGSAHTHASGSYATDSDAHTHGPGTLSTGDESSDSSYLQGTGVVKWHPTTYHQHDVDSGVTGSDSHSHDVTGNSGSESAHTHSVSNDLSSAQSILPPYLVGQWIQRTS